MTEPRRNDLLQYLPDIFTVDPFMASFLHIFEEMWDPLDRQIDQLYAYFDPRLTPWQFLPWLGTWVDIVLDENWPVIPRRALVYNAADLYRRRGTKGGLRDYLALFLGVVPLIEEDGPTGKPFHFSVIIRGVSRQIIEEEGRIRRIIDDEKPAQTTYTLILEE